MRFTILIDDDWNETISSPDLPGWTVTRQLEPKGVRAKGTFPRPPAGERPPAGQPHSAMCDGDEAALQQAQKDVLARRATSAEAYGRYLFETLIGTAAWNDVKTRAGAAGAAYLELALCWKAGHADLHRLPWEMMRSADGFLAAARAPRVAITRMVAETTTLPVKLELPPRVLFVIGTSETERDIRPGAELLGLLRQLRGNARAISPRVLERATPRRIREMMAAFRPEIVHYVCHGDVEPDGRGFLELQPDDPGGDPRRYAEAILIDLDVAGTLPQIVVLSACQSGTMLHGQQTAPLAAALVGGGIPIVVAMAGQVSDLACRLFTQRFGEAILVGDPIVAATAEGRRAPFADGLPPHKSIDWAYPTVFLSAKVPADFAPTPRPAAGVPDPTEAWVRGYQLLRDPVFCARQEFFTAFHQVFEPGGKAVLGLYGDSGLGKSRLLLELGAQALRDGHVPLVVGTNDDKLWEPPRTAAAFVKALLEALVVACNTLGVAPPANSQLQCLDPFNPNDQALTDQLKFELRGKTAPTTRSIQLALEADLAYLTTEARRMHPLIGRAPGRAIVLLDAVQEYDKALLSDLFTRKILGHFGFGTSAATHVPVVLTFNMQGPAQEILKPVVEAPIGRAWLTLMEVGRFKDNGEDMLAYERALLHPSSSLGSLLTGFSDKRLVRTEGKDDALVSQWEGNFRVSLQGQPKALSERQLYFTAMVALQADFLKVADDEDVLKRLGVAR